MDGYTVYIKPGKLYSNPIEFILRLIAINQQIKFNLKEEKKDALLIFDDSDPENSIPIAVSFYENLLINKIYNFEYYFKDRCIIETSDGVHDEVATAFYMVNCFQEYSTDANSLDQFNRFPFNKSYQYHYNNIEKNVVQDLIDVFCRKFIPGHKLLKTRSRIFVSHDIDTIHGALLQDGFWALRHKRFDVIFKLIFNALLLRPDWKNIDMIMKINDVYGLKSTFFWIVNNRKGEDGTKNADYKINRLKPLLEKIEKHGYFNGLHKSYSSLSFQEEIGRFPYKVRYNRNHFIHYKLPDLWYELESTGIQADFSLGFAQSHGFRNSYGLPFSPYSLDKGTAFSFIEVPLNIMDTTFHKYLKQPADITAETVIGFIDRNMHNSVLSLLWHNIYFTDYKYNGYLKEYKKIMGYIYEMRIGHITPPEILKEYAYGE